MAFELAPLRAWNDFLGGGARFQLPNFQDSEKTTKRIVNNLLYYQSNYMLIYGILFCAVGYQILINVLLFLLFRVFDWSYSLTDKLLKWNINTNKNED